MRTKKEPTVASEMKAFRRRNPFYDFTLKLVNLQTEAGRLGLYRTMHKLHDANKVLPEDITDFHALKKVGLKVVVTEIRKKKS